MQRITDGIRDMAAKYTILQIENGYLRQQFTNSAA
jgi:hypothetical protein